MSNSSNISGAPTNPAWGPSGLSDKQVQTWIWIGIGVIVLVAAYWNSLSQLWSEWKQPEYSHGYLIPAFAAVLLCMRREPFPEEVPASHRWWGVMLLALGFAIRVWGTRSVLFTVDYISFIPSLMGIFVMMGGLRTLLWAGPPIGFLVFMYPLPRFLKESLLHPLQEWATRGSVFWMQTLGVEVYREGNGIHLERMNMNVVEACSGMRMSTIFLALSVAIAMIVVNRPWWERLIIVASAVPVALVANISRITITGLLYNMNVKEEIAHRFFHDFAGLVMMPIALGVLFLELHILAKLFIETGPSAPGNVGFVPKVPRGDSAST